MKKYLETLKNNKFFRNLTDEAIFSLVSSEACYIKEYHAGTTIYDCGQPIFHAGVVLEGEIDVLHMTEDGYENIVNRLLPSHTFGESFCCVSAINTINTFRSVTKSTVLFINLSSLLQTLPTRTDDYSLFTQNVINTLASNNIQLNTKIHVLTKKTLREKLLAYFEVLSDQTQSNEITLPFNREQLANYLASERSSVCRELSKLAEEQIIEIHKNQITLLV